MPDGVSIPIVLPAPHRPVKGKSKINRYQIEDIRAQKSVFGYAAAMAGGSNDAPVFADERQARIAELVSVRGRARIGELAETFGVTEPTIRKDLSALQERGLLKRTHGGALAVHPTVDRELAQRQDAHRASKEAIADACVQLLQDGDSVFLDSGTSVEAVARRLAREPDGLRLSVLTNSLGVATALADVSRIDCVLLGGHLRRVDGSVVGDLALDNLQRFSFSSAFLGVSGFSELGISVGSLAEASLKAAVIERARRVVLPLDHTKVGATDFARVSDLDSVDVVVMDEASPAVRELCAGYDIELITAEQAV
jgi:DeoR/GlpR family transcriptional regulator of sugar metabolism